MTLNGHTETNGKNGLAGAELPPDGLDLVQQLQHHLASNPEDAQTWQALQLLQGLPAWSPSLFTSGRTFQSHRPSPG